MSIPSDLYDPETFALMKRAFDDAWRAMEGVSGPTLDAHASMVRSTISFSIVTAVREGERDPDKLRVLALELVERRVDDR